MALESDKVWVQQCEAARGIRERWGTEKALGYLVGEKLLGFVREADARPEFAKDLPAFVQEVRRVFSQDEIRAYLDGVRLVGPQGHTLTDEEFALLRDEGVFDEDPVRGAEDVLLMDRIREMLLA